MSKDGLRVVTGNCASAVRNNGAIIASLHAYDVIIEAAREACRVKGQRLQDLDGPSIASLATTGSGRRRLPTGRRALGLSVGLQSRVGQQNRY